MLDNFRAIAAARQALLNEDGVYPFGVEIEKILSPTEGIIDGRRTILAGTNNYLGLTFDPDCIEAACSGAPQRGHRHDRLADGERQLSRPTPRSSGSWPRSTACATPWSSRPATRPTSGMLSALAGRDDVMLLDADCHASIYDGCRLAGAEVIRFRHNNAEDLDKRLRRLGERTARTLIVVEGIYSMLGDRAPLAEIVAVKRELRRPGCSWTRPIRSGVLGEHGRGLAEEAGVEDAVDFIVGTFSKSLGGVGGFCVSDHPELDILRYASRPYMFTASPSPSIVASARAALGLLQARPELRKRLWENAHASL